MRTRRHVCTHSPNQTLSHTRKTFPAKRSLRFVVIFVIAAIVSAAIAVLAFAQKPEPVLSGATETLQPSRVAVPRRLTPTGPKSRSNKLPGADQDQQQEQEQSGRDQQRKSQLSRGPQEGRVRKARPF